MRLRCASFRKQSTVSNADNAFALPTDFFVMRHYQDRGTSIVQLDVYKRQSKTTIPDPDEKSNSPERDLEELYRKMRRMSDPAYPVSYTHLEWSRLTAVLVGYGIFDGIMILLMCIRSRSMDTSCFSVIL